MDGADEDRHVFEGAAGGGAASCLPPRQQHLDQTSALPLPAAHARRSAERPAKRAESPNSSSMRISWLYFAVRSERESEPVLI